jgi:hypothetical protein
VESGNDGNAGDSSADTDGDTDGDTGTIVIDPPAGSTMKIVGSVEAITTITVAGIVIGLGAMRFRRKNRGTIRS